MTQRIMIERTNFLAALLIAASAIGLRADEGQWQWTKPEFVVSEKLPRGISHTHLLTPRGFAPIVDRDGYLVLERAAGTPAATTIVLLRDTQGGAWNNVARLENVVWPQAAGIQRDIVIVGRSPQEDEPQSIQFYRVASNRIASRQPLAQLEKAPPRLLPLAIHARDDDTSVVVLKHYERSKSDLLFYRSEDGGKSWSNAVRIARTAMGDDDGVRIITFSFSEQHRGVIVVERENGLWFYRTRDAGKEWTKEALELNDDLPRGAIRFPVASVGLPQGVGLFYMAYMRSPAVRSRYFFATSSNEARDWAPSRPITAWLSGRGLGLSLLCQAAALDSRIAFSYITDTAIDTTLHPFAELEFEPKFHVLLSEDGGRQWNDQKLHQCYHGFAVFNILRAAPAQNGIVFFVSVFDPDSRKTSVFRQQYAPVSN
ncbi:MAG: glycoside hydrolase [Planctomycetes bacterium]|nr:glycoside hydrolase [Planctomycetota bacterium]